MATVLAAYIRQRKLEQAIVNFVTDGFEIATREDFRVELVRVRSRFLLGQRRERVVLEVDPYGRIQRVEG